MIESRHGIELFDFFSVSQTDEMSFPAQILQISFPARRLADGAEGFPSLTFPAEITDIEF